MHFIFLTEFTLKFSSSPVTVGGGATPPGGNTNASITDCQTQATAAIISRIFYTALRFRRVLSLRSSR